VSRAVWRADGMGLLDDVIQDIHVVVVAGGEPKQLTNDLAMNYNPVWAANGQHIVYAAAFDPGFAPMATHLRVVTTEGKVTDLANSGFLVARNS
jgi:Tol biopolymer transport system component